MEIRKINKDADLENRSTHTSLETSRAIFKGWVL